MIDHCSYAVKDFDKSSVFYDETLKILGCQRVKEFEIEDGIDSKLRMIGYGDKYCPVFWISNNGKFIEEQIGNAQGFHLAFVAPNKKAVDDWYNKCLELGGKDNGKPGQRLEYHPGYYGAFIIDPSGWRIEAAIHNYRK
jgi:catechol 2,3-dioxygenase-like lactoylglutathione lyase family enzyme